MKKQFSVLAIVMAIFMGVTSCNNTNDGGELTGDGTLKINFNFATVVDKTKAATSEAKPTTSWSNISNLQLVLVQSGIAKVVRPVTITATGSDVNAAQIFDRIPVGTYDIYLIGNNNKEGNVFGSSTAKIGTTAAIQAGANFNTTLFNLIASTNYLGTAPAGAAYDEASELFVGYASGSVVADQTTPTIDISLARAVSLLRVRIDQTDALSAANTIDFTNSANTNTSIRLRRHADALKLSTVAPYFVSQFDQNRVDRAFVSTKKFKSVAPASGYDGEMGLGADFTLWNDYVILPGGSAATGAEKFNLLLSGHAPNGYVGVNGVTSTGTGDAARVWWQADVDGFIAANGILSLNVKVATKGFVDPNPPVIDTYGKLDISVSLVDWSPVKNVNVPM